MVERGEEEPENPRRSILSNVKVPIRFKNRTGRRVKVVWLNYQGEEVPYATLEMSSCPSSELGEEQPISQLAYYTVDTFVTHPWIAVDEESNKRMLLNSQDIYFPSPPQVRRMDYERRVAIVVRTDVVITLPGNDPKTLPSLQFLITVPSAHTHTHTHKHTHTHTHIYTHNRVSREYV